ncbi:hypothetical protein HAZT_HAZT004530 [Hyalella azteca]|uniref:Uncharacterized protein n=1 Tax=Hyalella azteca TaxID=294128 RepID=A0A6A0GZB3_HYAAZ|nr:hypothetical protein HAZT_HAZT004530 [Hyalella azteca]
MRFAIFHNARLTRKSSINWDCPYSPSPLFTCYKLSSHVLQCTIELPDRFQDIFRPVVDCAMCRNVTHVDKVARLSPQLFEQRRARDTSFPSIKILIMKISSLFAKMRSSGCTYSRNAVYAYTGRPVLVLDGQRDWTAPRTFSFDFFKNIYAPDSPVLSHSYRDCQFFPYQTSFSSLRDVFNMSRDRVNMRGEPWYIGW